MGWLKAVLVTLALGTATFTTVAPASIAAAVDAPAMLQPPDGQPQQPVTSGEQNEGELTSAGWANVLWIVVVLALGVAFVWLAMVGLRSRTRE